RKFFIRYRNNIEINTHVRLNIDINGRSRIWLQAYITARLLDIEAGADNKSSTGNLLFRADCPYDGLNVMFCRFYHKMRATPEFERDVFERHGIRFASMARRDGIQIKIRPAKITINNKEFLLDLAGELGQELVERAARGEIAALQEVERRTGRLREFADIYQYASDREAGRAIRSLVREQYPHWWQSFKRYQVRRDIFIMTGIRSWLFFERGETLDKLREGYINVRNRIILKMMPSSAKNGNFIGCLFGINDCRASSDIANPVNRSLPDAGTQKQGDHTGDTDGNPDTKDTTYGDGSGEDMLKKGVQEGLEGGNVSKAIVRQILGKLNIATGIASLLDSLARFDKALNNHSLSKIIMVARGTQLVGLYTTYKIAADQQKTGELHAEELGEMVDTIRNSNNNEGWQTVVEPNRGNVATAMEVLPNATKEQFCDPEYQAFLEAMMSTNPIVVNKLFQYSCPDKKIGGPSLAQKLEDAWNNSIIGKVVHPILEEYNNWVGPIFRFLDGISDVIIGPVVNAIISTLGLQDNIEALMGWLAEKVISFAGGGPMVGPLTPQGQMINFLIQGGAYLSESAMRFQGAALTTPQTQKAALDRYYAYMTEQRQNQSFAERYLSIDNPRSLASKTLFAFANWQNDIPGSLATLATSLVNPAKALTATVDAATTSADAKSPYAAANFAEIETYDFPTQCLDANPLTMTPQSATNADDLGIFAPSELNWDMLSNKNMFYTALYDKLGDDDDMGRMVWNCALLDNAVSAAIGGLYGYKGEAAYE
ncbi:hypothetical protein IRY61_03295, partial [Candidatus Saccharibacteria bacterium]|nr:hypothetical protein [Candidatus Saccharibacteria bacterium]